MQRLRGAALGACRRLLASRAHGDAACSSRQLHAGAPPQQEAAPLLGALVFSSAERAPAGTLTHAASLPGRAAAKRANVGDPLVLQAQLRDAAGRLPSARLRAQGRIPAVVFNQARAASAACFTHRARASQLAPAALPLTFRAAARSGGAQFDEDKLLITLDERELLRRVRARCGASAAPPPRRSGFRGRRTDASSAPQLTAFKKSGFLSRVFTVELPGDAPQRIPVLPKQVRRAAATPPDPPLMRRRAAPARSTPTR